MEAQAVALLIAGLIASPFIQFVKEKLHWGGWKAQGLAWVLCVVIALVALAVTKQLAHISIPSDPVVLSIELGAAISVVVTLANTIYKLKFDQPGS